MQEQFTEYAVRVTVPGHHARIIPCATFERDAIRAYDHEAALHGEEAVEMLRRQVRRSEWVAGKLPRPVERDDGPGCDPMPRLAKVTDAGSIDTWQEAQP